MHLTTYNKYNYVLPAFEAMLSTWAFQVRLGDIVTPSIFHVVTLSISFPSTFILGIVRQCPMFWCYFHNISYRPITNNICRLLKNTHRIIATYLEQGSIINEFVRWGRGVQGINMYDKIPWAQTQYCRIHRR